MSDDVASESSDKLPEKFRTLFWDCDFEQLSLTEHLSYIMRRILDEGTWDSMRWLRATVGDDAISEWIMSGHGERLSSRSLRFWQMVLDLPDDPIDGWVKQARNSVWERRNEKR